ncbi:hypothetical protein [Streptomyces uncialis]|uniref:hypothetical protein n=1 Tax=Streptomyces uncialis TaxID=1048205 RepID=UPI00093DFC88|nr:hypothetical protein [Streptomyces uncialis]
MSHLYGWMGAAPNGQDRDWRAHVCAARDWFAYLRQHDLLSLVDQVLASDGTVEILGLLAAAETAEARRRGL